MKIWFAIVFSLGLLSCSSERPKGKTAAEVLYKEALHYVEKERYLLATEKLNQLRTQYPYSYFATSAELLQADILFEQKNFIEAAGAYIVFRDFHPRYKDIESVVWKIAESFYQQLPSTFDRDLSPADQAIKYYKEIIDKYPKSKYVQDSIKRINNARSQLAAKDKYIADFYFRTGVYDSAMYRYLDIIKQWPKRPSLIKHSYIRLIRSAFQAKKYKECVNLYERASQAISSEDLASVKSYLGSCQSLAKEKANG